MFFDEYGYRFGSMEQEFIRDLLLLENVSQNAHSDLSFDVATATYMAISIGPKHLQYFEIDGKYTEYNQDIIYWVDVARAGLQNLTFKREIEQMRDLTKPMQWSSVQQKFVDAIVYLFDDVPLVKHCVYLQGDTNIVIVLDDATSVSYDLSKEIYFHSKAFTYYWVHVTNRAVADYIQRTNCRL